MMENVETSSPGPYVLSCFVMFFELYVPMIIFSLSPTFLYSHSQGPTFP